MAIGERWKPDRVVYRTRPKRPKALLTWRRLAAAAAILALGLLYLGLYKFLRLPYFQVSRIEVRGAETIEAESLKELLAGSLKGDRWHFWPRSNILFLSPRVLEATLKSRYAEIRDASIEKRFPNAISVIVTERTIWAVYCVKASESRQCFFMDREGVIFRKAPLVEGSLILTLQTDRGAPPLGASVLRPEEAAFFESAAKAFEDYAALPISGFELRANAPKDFWVKTKEGFQVIAAKDADPAATASVLKAVLEKEVKEKRGTLEYIDARFGNKAFVKYLDH